VFHDYNILQLCYRFNHVVVNYANHLISNHDVITMWLYCNYMVTFQLAITWLDVNYYLWINNLLIMHIFIPVYRKKLLYFLFENIYNLETDNWYEHNTLPILSHIVFVYKILNNISTFYISTIQYSYKFNTWFHIISLFQKIFSNFIIS
jgi:hypothetical protein